MVPGQADTPRENVKESAAINSDSARPRMPQPGSLSDADSDSEHGGRNVAEVAAGLLKCLERQAKDLHQPWLKGSIGEGPNHSNYSDQTSVRIKEILLECIRNSENFNINFSRTFG